MHHQPDGAAFDIVLLLHVGCVVVGLVTAATAAAKSAGRANFPPLGAASTASPSSGLRCSP